MGWGRYLLLGDFGQQMDIQDRERQMNELRQQVDSQWSRDMDQDQQIQMLQSEVRELKLYLASLVRLLGTKQIATQAEVEELVRMVEGASGS